MKARYLAVLAPFVLAAACEATPDDVGSDVQNHREDCQLVTNFGNVPWGDAGLSATYKHDFETHRFFVNVETPSKFQLEVTQKGTNRHLDLVMAVYSPDGERVATDDDSGWGRYPRLTVDATKVGLYEVRVDPKLPETGEDDEVEFVRGKYRVQLDCLSELCDVTGAQAFAAADTDPALDAYLETAEDIDPVCSDEEEYMCTTQSAYAVRYTFNPALAPELEEAADDIANEEYAYGYVSTGHSRSEFASDLELFEMNVEQVDAILGYSDYEVATMEIEDDCSPDYCMGNWWFLQSSERGEIHAIRLGYYESYQ